jgi:hypothetical protein
MYACTYIHRHNIREREFGCWEDGGGRKDAWRGCGVHGVNSKICGTVQRHSGARPRGRLAARHQGTALPPPVYIYIYIYIVCVCVCVCIIYIYIYTSVVCVCVYLDFVGVFVDVLGGPELENDKNVVHTPSPQNGRFVLAHCGCEDQRK